MWNQRSLSAFHAVFVSMTPTLCAWMGESYLAIMPLLERLVYSCTQIVDLRVKGRRVRVPCLQRVGYGAGMRVEGGQTVQMLRAFRGMPCDGYQRLHLLSA